jgi:hypothetical protein
MLAKKRRSILTSISAGTVESSSLFRKAINYSISEEYPLAVCSETFLTALIYSI